LKKQDYIPGLKGGVLDNFDSLIQEINRFIPALSLI